MGLPVRLPNTPLKASVIPYPAIVVGLPDRLAKVIPAPPACSAPPDPLRVT